MKAMIRGKHDDYFTIGEVAAMARVKVKSVQNWVAGGVLRVMRLGRRRFIPLSSIEQALGAEPRDPLPAEVERQLALVRRDLRRRSPRVIRSVTKSRESEGGGGNLKEDASGDAG